MSDRQQWLCYSFHKGVILISKNKCCANHWGVIHKKPGYDMDNTQCEGVILFRHLSRGY